MMEVNSGAASVVRYFGDNDDIYDQLQRVIPEIMEDDEPDEDYNEVLIFNSDILADSGTRYAYQTVVFLQDGEPVSTAIRTTESRAK